MKESVNDVEGKILEDEIKEVKEFIAKNNYPSYKEMNERIKNQNYISFFDVLAEYGEICHSLCKRLYENQHDTFIVQEIGNKFNNMGGFTTMQMNFYVLKLLSPLAYSRNINVRCVPRNIEIQWNGIGEWKH